MKLEPIAKSGSVPAVGGKGIRLYDAEGKVYYDLSEISTVLGQKNEHFIRRMTEKLNDLVGGKIADSPEKVKFYKYLSISLTKSLYDTNIASSLSLETFVLL